MYRNLSWLRPSFGAFFVAAVFLSLFYEGQTFLRPVEVCRYLADGQAIYLNEDLDKVDSSTLSPIPWDWLNVRWACSLCVYKVYSLWGATALVLYFYAMLAATLFILYRTLIRSGANLFIVVIFMAILYSLFHHRFLLSSHIFSYLFLAALVGAFRARLNPDRLDWIFLPPIFLVWGNLDHDWIAGIMFLFMSLMGRWMDMQSSESLLTVKLVGFWNRINFAFELLQIEQIRLWFRMLIVCGLCGFANPVLFSSSLGQYFSEVLRPVWNAHDTPNFSVPSLSAIAVFLTIFGFLISRLIPNGPKPTVEAGLPTLLFIYIALKGQENAWLMLIVVAVPLAIDFDALAKRFLGRFTLYTCSEEILATWQSNAKGDLLWSVILGVILSGLWLGQSPSDATLHPGSDSFSQPAITFMQEHAESFHGCLTSPETGAAVHWYLQNAKTSLDERTESFNPRFYNAVSPILMLAPNWVTIVKQGDFDSAILASGYPLATGLSVLPGWHLGYADTAVSIYFHDSPVPAVPTKPKPH